MDKELLWLVKNELKVRKQERLLEEVRKKNSLESAKFVAEVAIALSRLAKR